MADCWAPNIVTKRTPHEQAVAQAQGQVIVERNAKILVAILKEIGQGLRALTAPSAARRGQTAAIGAAPGLG